MEFNIKESREKLGITQVEVAKRTGVSYAMYRLWEQGISTPNEDNMKKLMRVLQIKEQ